MKFISTNCRTQTFYINACRRFASYHVFFLSDENKFCIVNRMKIILFLLFKNKIYEYVNGNGGGDGDGGDASALFKSAVTKELWLS